MIVDVYLTAPVTGSGFPECRAFVDGKAAKPRVGYSKYRYYYQTVDSEKLLKFDIQFNVTLAPILVRYVYIYTRMWCSVVMT